MEGARPVPVVRTNYTVTVRYGRSSPALARAIYDMAAPCVPDHRWIGPREYFRFFADGGRAETVHGMLCSAHELLEFTREDNYDDE
jgi:hypothetical protein